MVTAYRTLFRRDLDTAELDAHLAAPMERNTVTALGSLQSIERELSTVDKEVVIKVLVMVAIADGDLGDEEATFILKAGEALSLPEEHTYDLIRGMFKISGTA